MALSSAITLVLGIALLASSHGSAGGIFFGILFLLAVIAGTVVTGFWFHYDHLESWQKGLAKAAYYPGGAFGIVALWIMKTINIFVGLHVRGHLGQPAERVSYGTDSPNSRAGFE